LIFKKRRNFISYFLLGPQFHFLQIICHSLSENQLGDTLAGGYLSTAESKIKIIRCQARMPPSWLIFLVAACRAASRKKEKNVEKFVNKNGDRPEY